MAAQKGRSMVLKTTSGVSPVTYITIGGMRSNSIAINGEIVDITDKDSNAWRDLLANAGVKNVSISGSGVFKGSAGETLLRGFALAQTLNQFQVVFENGDMFVGAFQVATLEFTGEHNGARMFSCKIESSGETQFQAA